MTGADHRRRLFVPLKAEPFGWFESGAKEWEIRRNAGAFALERLTIGQRVELRRGYTGDSLWGTISELQEGLAAEILGRIPFESIIPTASTAEDAALFINDLLGSGEILSAVRVQVDEHRSALDLAFSGEYLEPVGSGDKTTTVRFGHRDVSPGPAIFHFGADTARRGAIIEVRHVAVPDLTARDAIDDGFASVADLLAALERHYPEMRPDSPLTILEFRCRHD